MLFTDLLGETLGDLSAGRLPVNFISAFGGASPSSSSLSSMGFSWAATPAKRRSAAIPKDFL